MPCETEGFPTLRDNFDKAVKLLCESCRLLEASNIGMTEELEKWWNHHKAIDEENRREEEEQKKKKALRAAVLAKLTDEEKKVLNLR